jgi:serine/threonine-protein kinase
MSTLVEEFMSDLVGKKLGQYELLEVAGVGGLATVYKASQPALERFVAVKVLHSSDRMLLTRFEREAKASARLRHRNILMVYEYGEEAGLPYIAMEYVEQGTLDNYLTGTPMAWEHVITLSAPIARALHHAHEHGLIHRDVKPSNILMPQPDWPLLADFGLVKVEQVDEELTGTGVAVGTPSYMPPEQASGDDVDSRADMYSLGVIMYQMITGRLPFEYNNMNLQIFAHLSELPPAPSELNSKCPPQLEHVIETAMEKDPEDRYADLQEMTEVLEEILKESTYKFSSPPTPHGVPTPAIDDQHPADGYTPPTPAELPVRQEAKILLKDGSGTIEVPFPSENGLIIGRTQKTSVADINLGPHKALEAGVSRQHAQLYFKDGAWLIDDLKSMNGTYVNEKKIVSGQAVSLKNGDVIRCGKLAFIFLIS